MEVDGAWSWNILWRNEAYVYLNGEINTHKCASVCDKDTPVCKITPYVIKFCTKLYREGKEKSRPHSNGDLLPGFCNTTTHSVAPQCASGRPCLITDWQSCPSPSPVLSYFQQSSFCSQECPERSPFWNYWIDPNRCDKGSKWWRQ